MGKQNDLEDLDPSERRRFEALWELFHAEVTYLINHLIVMRNVFYKPLQLLKPYGFLVEADDIVLFANLEELIHATTAFAKLLLPIFKDANPSSITESTAVIVKA